MKGRRLTYGRPQRSMFEEPPKEPKHRCAAFVGDQVRCGKAAVVYAKGWGGWVCGKHSPGMSARKVRSE